MTSHPDNPQLQLALDFIRYTNQNVFLTGKAGTGKTTFLRNLKHESPKRMVVVAPTGVAAINAGGVTIHSFFQMSFGPQIPQTNPSLSISNPAGLNAPTAIKRYSKEKINIIRSMDLLVIDEISMVRADLLDGIDEVLRRFRNRHQPFGGVQLLMIGDIQQLAPVVKEDEWQLLKSYYKTCYFFSSRALQQASFTSIELKHIYRQSDQEFIDLLNQIRENKADSSTLAKLNQRHRPNFEPDNDEEYITLTTHNYQAQQLNQTKLKALRAPAQSFEANVYDDFPEFLYPTDFQLVLKTGAQVMFVKNDSSPEKLYYNGKIGKITQMDEDYIEVTCRGDAAPIVVERDKWLNAKYTINKETQEIDEEVIGSFEQFPLKLAWAITIHKSQGLTFEKAIINARQSFAHGQVYVALSRCKSLEGLVLSTPIDHQSIKNDATVSSFSEKVEQDAPGDTELQQAKKQYQKHLLTELFDFKPIRWQLQYLIKLCDEHGALLIGDLRSKLLAILPRLDAELLAVSSKFERQIQQLLAQSPDAESNELLQQRVKRACQYYLEKLKEVLLQPLESAGFETDNKAVRKSFRDGFEKLHRELDSKQKVLECSQEGFQVKKYLEVKAHASLDLKGKTAARGTSQTIASEHPDFLRELLAWRSLKAEKDSTTISRILPQKTLLTIANELPATQVDLQEIKGMGGKKMQQHGKDLLEMTIAYRKKHQMELPENADQEPIKAMLDSKHMSYALFKAGKSITDIARERKLSSSTIEGHLNHFVAQGELSLKGLVEEDKQQAILKQLKKSKAPSMSALKSAMGDQFSYSEIRFVLAYFNAKNKK
ncbi:helix-turn-helix domain-containing protein [Sunxiuqinia elliptica]|uniref:HRDC domain-containing protein n=1 Tax=Sunxiuqinia elliptica TaxID=655355 RepID=A0A1I2FRB5_9BACT|nr:helix-turn-helix domain-containing protein [Sunxiuqinia elliptica]SFF07318.1 HRDC domain-containing protein [Sunxiuqinia elliptica]